MAGTGGELILLQILIILAAAKLGGELAERLGQSSVRIFKDIKPLGAILVPIFFVLLGVQVDLTAISGRGVPILIIGTALSVVAILTKLASGLGVIRS